MPTVPTKPSASPGATPQLSMNMRPRIRQRDGELAQTNSHDSIPGLDDHTMAAGLDLR